MTDVYCATWKKRCDKAWEDLEEIDPLTRYCSLCRQNVKSVESQALLDRMAALGHCVAIVPDDGPIMMGLVIPSRLARRRDEEEPGE